ncbi:MAG: efflux RND transporter periplasmic adaptor subunit [Gammaproteobacteria bacterium]|nr:efflux RND transporter periplasmic adaptor subunit [Gammaproteobacteria bacterium]
MLQTARARLLNWQMDESDIRAMEARSEPQRAVTFRAPADGVVLEKAAVQGMRFMPGEMLYRLADLREVWLMASVYEQDIADLQTGQSVRLHVDSFPPSLAGRVGFVYPTGRDHTDRESPRAVAQRGPAPAPWHVRSRRHTGRAPRPTRAQCARFGRSRQRQAPARAGRAWRRPVRAARRARRPARRRLRRDPRGTRRGRSRGGQREFPDRRREQPEGGARQLRARRPRRPARHRRGCAG